MRKLLIIVLLIVGCGTEPEDCAFVEGGTAELDNCNVCDSDKTNDCVPDCAGVWGGDTTIDECGVCGGDGSSCIVDIDGTAYQIIQIGDQWWMAENLKVTHYNNGDKIPAGDSNTSISDIDTLYSGSEWAELETGAYAVYDDADYNADIYGNLYNWYAVDDVRSVCPEGWHVPSDEEYKELEMFLGMSEEDANSTGYRGTDEGSKLAGNSDLWVDGDLENNSEFGTSGFTGLPAGYRYNDTGYFASIGDLGYFWSSSKYSSYSGRYRLLYYYKSNVYRNEHSKNYGFSIRCLRD